MNTITFDEPTKVQLDGRDVVVGAGDWEVVDECNGLVRIRSNPFGQIYYFDRTAQTEGQSA